MDHSKGTGNASISFLLIPIAVCIVFFSAAFSSRAQTIVTSTQTVSITAEVAATSTAAVPGPGPSTGGGGGGGGGGGSSEQPLANKVVFRGLAYPGSIITLLNNSVVAAEIPAGPDASFEISKSGISAGTYNFSLRAQDQSGRMSGLQVYSIKVTAGVTTFVTGIFFPPTIAVDKSEVRQGDILTIFGQSVPSAMITMVVNSNSNIIKKTSANANGVWAYKLDTLPLEYGDHQVKVRGETSSDITSFSDSLAFKVGSISKTKDPAKPVPSKNDLNGDKRVNIADFSIMAFWFNKANPPKAVDINQDGKVTLADFSILAYYWTG